jgi:hypothetical protein
VTKARKRGSDSVNIRQASESLRLSAAVTRMIMIMTRAVGYRTAAAARMPLGCPGGSVGGGPELPVPVPEAPQSRSESVPVVD